MQILLALALVAASAVALPAADAQPCYPDACCGSTLDCLLYPVERLLDDVAFATECVVVYDWPDLGWTVCVDPDPRSTCHVSEERTTKLGTEWRCLL